MSVPAPSESRRDHLATLTSVRFFAALWVTVYHYGIFRAPLPGGPIGRVVEKGHFGVAFFFVLSGFILAHTYASRLMAPRFEWKPFLVARFARVYPLYVAALGLGIVQQLVVHAPSTSRALFDEPAVAVATNLLLVQNWHPVLYNAINGPGWSIACEAVFYLSFPLLGALALRCDKNRLALLAIGGLVFGLVMDLTMTNLAGDLAVARGLDGSIVGTAMAIGGRFLPFARIDEFLLGIVAYRAAHEFGGRRILVGAAALGAVVVGTLVAMRALAGGLRMPTSGFLVTIPSKGESLFPIVAALAIVALARLRGERPRWLAHPALVYGGKISFALYLVHLPVLFAVLPLRDRGVPAAAVFALAATLALAAAAAGFHGIEEPMRRVILACSRRARAVPEPFPAAP